MAVAVGYTGCIWSHRKILRSHSSWAVCLGVRLPTGSSVTKTSRGCVSGSCTQLWQQQNQELQPSAVSGVPVIYRDGAFIQDQRSQDESHWVVVGDPEGVMVLKDPMKSCVDKFFGFSLVLVYG